MGLAVLPEEVVDIISSDQGKRKILAQFPDPFYHFFLSFHSRVLYFQVEIAFPQYFPVFFSHFPGLFVFLLKEKAGNLPFHTSGERDQPLGMLSQYLLVNSRPVIETF